MKKLLLALALAAATTSAHAGTFGPYDDLVVFGDSFSDPGNVFAATGGAAPNRTELPNGQIAYPNGMWSDGVTWAHKLGATLTSGRNFAFGGARAGSDNPLVPDLLEQTALYTPPADLGSNPITAIFIGGNDFLKLIADAEGTAVTPQEKALAVGQFFFNVDGTLTGTGQAAIADTYARIIGGIFGTPAIGTGPAKPGAVQLLAQKGLTDFVIFGLPDIGQQPGLPANFAAFLTGLSTQFNGILKDAVALLDGAPNGVDASFFDVAGVLAPVFGDNSPFAVTDAPCVLKDADDNVVSVCDNPGDFVLYDQVHPTDGVHAVIADAFTDHVTPIPLPAGAPLLLLGLGALGVASRRRVAARMH